MENETLVHKCDVPIGSDRYEILVYSRPDGSHVAKTALDTYDVIVNNAATLGDALKKQADFFTPGYRLKATVSPRTPITQFYNFNYPRSLFSSAVWFQVIVP